MTEQHQPTRMTRDLRLQEVLFAEVADMARGVMEQDHPEMWLALSAAFDVQRPVAAWVLGFAYGQVPSLQTPAQQIHAPVSVQQVLGPSTQCSPGPLQVGAAGGEAVRSGAGSGLSDGSGSGPAQVTSAMSKASRCMSENLT